MPVDGNGVYDFPTNSVNPAIPDTLLEPADFNAMMADLKVYLNTLIANSGGIIPLMLSGVLRGQLVITESSVRLVSNNPGGNSAIELDALAADTFAAVAKLFANTTAQATRLELYRGDNGVTVDVVLASGLTSTSYIKGKLAIGKDTATYTVDIAGTGGMRIPGGTTLERPAGAEAVFRYNKTLKLFEGHDDASWFVFPRAQVYSTASWSNTQSGQACNGVGYSLYDPNTGVYQMWGWGVGGASPLTIPFPVTFTSQTTISVVATGFADSDTNIGRFASLAGVPDADKFSVYLERSDGTHPTGTVRWQAMGR